MCNRNPEPSLDDFLNDPILHALLARDGLKVEEFRRFLDQMKQRLRLPPQGRLTVTRLSGPLPAEPSSSVDRGGQRMISDLLN